MLTREKLQEVELECFRVPPGKKYVRSFFFSRRFGARWVEVHLGARILFLLALSAALLRTISTEQPDPLMGLIFWGIALIVFTLSGVPGRLARLYFVITLPPLISLFSTWFLFNPQPGKIILIDQPFYNGNLPIGLGVAHALWLGIILVYYGIRKRLFGGIVLASLITLIAASIWSLPAFNFAFVPFGRPLTLLVSDQTVYITLTKIIGYAGMVVCTVALVVSTREIELLGLLKQMHLPQALIFFASTVCRSLNMALTDYQIVRQAQLARAVEARPRTLSRHIRERASLAIPMVALMIRRSSEIGDALMARGYRLGSKQTEFFELQAWRWWDWFILLGSVALCLFAFAPHALLSAWLIHW